MESIWSKTVQLEKRPALKRDLNADIVVIGAGMAGILTAYQLKKKGAGVIILEADSIASGQTRNTTAKITSQHNLIYQMLIRRFGKEQAQQYAQANQTAIEEYARIIEEEGIDCDFERKDAYLYSTEEKEPLIREAEAAASLGIPAEFVEKVNLPFPVKGAVRFRNQAQFHPLKFIKAVAKDLTIYEDTPVLKVEGHTLETKGHRVTAERIVFATHFPFMNMPGYYFSRVHQERAHVLALENAAQLDGMYISMDEKGYSFRNYGKYLFFGGGKYRTGENPAGGRYHHLQSLALRYFPRAWEAARWSTQDCITLDGVPYIGRFSPEAPDWFVATGFMKWGMTTSMAASMIISDQITGKKNPWAEVFSPDRFKLASIPKLIQHGAHTIRGLARESFALPRKTVDELPWGHGGVVDYLGSKVGVYKNEFGEVFMVDTRCPHMGCQLEWNPDEKSWDCPCHGSRFDYRGELITSPAQTDVGLGESWACRAGLPKKKDHTDDGVTGLF